MNTYLVISDTNYGVMVHVVNAESEASAHAHATVAGAWPGCHIYPIDTTTEGVVEHIEPSGG